ncbi:MAG: hypothetical protein FWG34_14870 [Oscillospiraceae bacterium]|jgi:hypothetical protein|nr:hypothetical protein [Oscillospiraceae bacterium]
MKNLNFRVFCLALICAAMATVLASCGDNAQKSDDLDNAQQNQDGGDPAEAEAEAPAEPEKIFPHETLDFGGYVFRLITAEDQNGNGLYYEDFEIEEAIGDVYNDALYERRLALEDNFNVKFSSINKGDISGDVKKTVNAGTDEYDLVLPRLNSAWNLITYCADLLALQNLSLGESWYDQNCIENLSVAKKLYTITGDAFTKHYDGIMLLIFNKQILQEHGLSSPYPIVSGGKWTLDAMGEMVKAVTKDVNGDGILDKDDMWGYAQQGDIVGAVINGAELKYMYKNADDIPYTMANTERMNMAIDKFLDFFRDYSWDTTRDANNAHLSAFWLFPEGRALFNGIMLHYIQWQLRGVEHDFGIIPIPKLDEAQSRYYTSTNAYHTYCYMMPKTVSDPERTAYIFDAMGFYGEKIIKPAYYDMCLTRKYTRDEESNEMLDIIFKSTVYDLGLYADFGNISGTVQNLILKGENTYSSSYEKIEPKVISAIEKFVASIED